MTESRRRYRITHRTLYEYSSDSSLCHNLLHLQPRELEYQRVGPCEIVIEPTPACRHAWLDSFGNHAEFFSIEEVHPQLTVTARSSVDRSIVPVPFRSDMSWSFVSEWIKNSHTPESIAAREFLFDSRYCVSSIEFHKYASSIAVPNEDFLQCLLVLNKRIHTEFRYVPSSTAVTTRPKEVLQKRRGVCQDFAHIFICCLRSLGIPARYVSGYLLTQPPPGKPRLVGADASHAWISAFAGPMGWIDFDPTNNVIPGDEHITVAWGRDYADVAPIQGVFVGGGFTELHVAVDVLPANETPAE